MKVSMQWVASLTTEKIVTTTEELTDRIGAQLGAIDSISQLGPKYDSAIVVEIISCIDHPNADRLHVCMVNDNGTVADVPRDEHGYIQVVCGASNVRADMLVVWLPPGSFVPSTYDSDRLILEAREIRGVLSHGMLASARELAIGDNHDGILELTEASVGRAITAGASFKTLLDLDDTIIDIENKMFTHRPDCFGQLGVAREIAGIQQVSFSSPGWYKNAALPTADNAIATCKVEVNNEIPELCPRYMLAAVTNVTIGPSPLWLQSQLMRLGVRSINNIVDMTNYLMLLTGQPLHAFDLDKVAINNHAQITIRAPKLNETITLLDGKTIQPRPEAILICEQSKAIALGGVMGGNNSEIDEKTTRILIECANFDMYNIRKTSMEHGIFTDAVTRFNKGQSYLQCPAVLSKAVELVKQLSPQAMLDAPIIDNNHTTESIPNVEVTAEFINCRLGTNLTISEIVSLLKNVEFDVDINELNLRITPPFWRTDIAISEDIIEEVGRLYGYDKLPHELPKRRLAPAETNTVLDFRSKVRSTLARGGANELLTYSFVPGKLITGAQQSTAAAFQLSNALSPELEYFRLSLTPSLLDKVYLNLKAGFTPFALFEMGKSHIKNTFDTHETTVPAEYESLSFVYASNEAASQSTSAPYFLAKHYLDFLLSQHRISQTLHFEMISDQTLVDDGWLTELIAPFVVNRSAIIWTESKQLLGVIGEFKTAVRRHFKLPPIVSGFELNLATYQSLLEKVADYRAIPRYPKVFQDITLRVDNSLNYQSVFQLLIDTVAQLKPEQSYATLKPLSLFQKDDQRKHMSFRLEIASYIRTLVAEDVNSLLDEVARVANEAFGADRI
ncbi:MAG: phenylalanine--tRNA ligase subunit beta [Candidatus Saccharimonadales bacterium]